MKTIEVRNPRNGSIDYYIEPLTSTKLADSSLDLRSGQTAWKELGIDGRIDVFQKWKKTLESKRDEIISELIKDTGRKSESVTEFDSIISTIDRWCQSAPDILKEKEIKTSSIPFLEIKGDVVPYELVGIISPWNLPLLLSLIDALPALLAGSAVIVKPSEITPRFSEPLQKTIEATPYLADVLKFVNGAGETGEAIIDLVDLVVFTGSVETGRKVGEACSKRFIPVSLELGGKDPAIVMKDADIDKATSALLWASVVNNGHSCLSIERVYVDQIIFDEFIEMLVKKAKTLKLAYPSPDDGEIGPIISASQKDIIEDHIFDAEKLGATIHSGGKIENHSNGYWCLPTVITDVNHEMKVMTEETFGPVIPVMSFSDIDEGLKLANDSRFGLSGAVFAGTNEDAINVADKLVGGAISINDAGLTAIMHEGEKNAFKLSGMGGSRMGSVSIKRFLRQKSYLINTGATDPWWF